MAGELRVERNLLLPDRSPARPDVIVCQPLRVLSWQLPGGHVVGEQAPCECEGIRKRWAWFDKRYVAGLRGVSP
jgi:hypothetical protein